MNARIIRSVRLLTRQRQRIIIGSCVGLSVGTAVAMRSSPPIRFDAPGFSSGFPLTSPPASPRGHQEGHRGPLSPALMKQLSGGSVVGFLSGLLVSVFSRTLVLVLGVSVVVIQVAAEYGIDLVDQLRLKQRLGKSRVLAALEKDPAFKLSFGLFFALSAFMHF
ncbi:hypothetical protein GGS21DRAFT_192648 [Xylaria nigripes]|nr:hypothetical protein GGS21DRAFT_192648 [Xylaria nigripes]